jgi:2-polyprenyl-3-methyl-5-hydroxy-6-metoxy-1,4-benzoquinol methylase
MQGEYIVCPLCGASETRLWGIENGWKAGKCCSCGLVYLNPRPSRSEISLANETGAHRTAAGVLDVVHARDARKVERYRRVLERLFADQLARQGQVRWLDVGAGFGEVVEAVQKRLPQGSVVEGIEPMRAKVAEARRRGLPITSRSLSDLPQRYHVISLINVFSHLPDPRGFLRDLHDHLLPGGDVLLETGNGGDLPNARSFPGPLCLPDHLQFAGEAHLEKFLSDSGFTVVAKHRERTDTLRLAVHWAAQKARGLPGKVRLPYTSPFRTVLYRARIARTA